MIRLENVTKGYGFQGQIKYIVKNASLTIPDGATVGLVGRNGAGKSTLLQMIAGTVNPNSGRVRMDGNVSWPIGLAGCIHPELSGTQNVRFIARVYGVDTDELVDFVGEFAQLGNHYYQPVRTYSSGMRARLNFGMSMGIRFDTYLIDEVTSVGDASFKARSMALFEDRVSTSGAIFVSHSNAQVKQYCKHGIVIEGGYLTYFEDVDEAIDRHMRNMMGDVYINENGVSMLD
jgi:capsular polysaccharide transport system ATP-binding protein